MNKLITSTLIVFLAYHASSQIVYEEGYFIDESNQKVNCLIKNIDWRNNPNEFQYKMSQKGPIETAGIITVKEFGINGVSRFIRMQVEIDRSSSQIGILSNQVNPVFQEDVLFLKVLIEGEASLFQYIDETNLTRFFFKLKDTEITQLVYKKYNINDQIGTNSYYQQQLFNHLNCQGVDPTFFERIGYRKKDLIKAFINYNECKNSEYNKYIYDKKRDLLNLKLKPGFNISSLSIYNSALDTYNLNYKPKSNIRIGIETEFILPFNKNKWSISIEPTYQYFKSKAEKLVYDGFSNSSYSYMSNVNYQSIELPLSLRHYFYFSSDSKLFTNAGLMLDFVLNSSLEFTLSDGRALREPLRVESQPNFYIGLGYQFKNRYGIELRYQTSREILGEYAYWQSNYNTLSVIFGLRLF